MSTQSISRENRAMKLIWKILVFLARVSIDVMRHCDPDNPYKGKSAGL